MTTGDHGIEARRAALGARRDELSSRLEAIRSELESHDTRDWEDLAVEREDDEVLEAEGQAAQQELRMIEAALGRIEAGDYGVCARCGAAIAPERLEALPFTPFCRDCAP